MQIQLEIISVGAPQTVPTKNGKSYQCVEVAYKKDGKIEGKKIMSFTNPSVFKAVQGFNQGDLVDVTTEKNEAGYWQWEGIMAAGAAPTQATPTAAASGGGTTQKTTSNYETKEERAARQVMIVRQSSLGHAVALMAIQGNKKVYADTAIGIAKEFEVYVMGKEPKSPVEIFEYFPDNDIPM